MNSAKIKSFLEVTTNIAVLVVAIIFLGSLIWNYFHQKPISQLHAGLEKGVALAQVPGVDYSQSTQTLLIAMNTKCGYCKESIPFYNQLIEEQQRGNKQTRLIALFPESDDAVKQYLQQNQLNIETVTAANLEPLNVPGTPTIILVDSSGKVIDFWIGKLQKNDEFQVSKTLG